MTTINVRKLDGEVVRRLKRRAAGNNRSLEGEVRHILEGAAGDDPGAIARRLPNPGSASAARDRWDGTNAGAGPDPRGSRRRAPGRPMSVVVDASVAVKWLVAEDGSDEADRLLAGSEELHAPRLMASEVANAPGAETEISRVGVLTAWRRRPLERRRDLLRRRGPPRAGAVYESIWRSPIGSTPVW